MAKLTFNQEEILAKLELLDKKQGEIDKRFKEAEAAIAEQRAAAAAAHASLDKLRAEVATALDREGRLHDRIDRTGRKVDAVLGVASGSVR